MSLPEKAESRKPKRDSEISSDQRRSGLSADEFCTAAKVLIAAGLHPVAIGKANPDKPDKPAGKAPWHKGVTGYNGVDPHPDRVMEWPQDVAGRIARCERGLLNIGMRMPVGGLGLDVDNYDDKRGATTIAEHEARFGCLPDTYRITARPYADGSGIRLYRIPDDWHGKTILKAANGSDGHVELIQRHHRLAAVPPSYHHNGQRYRIYDERTGQEHSGGNVPPLEDWPKLPDSWLDGIRSEPAKASREATDDEVEQFAAEHTRAEQRWHLAEYILPQLRNANCSTRNAAFNALHEAARTARVGWCSWAEAVGEIRKAAHESYGDRDGALDDADFARSIKTAVGAANAESLPDLEARYEKRLADEQSARAMVREWKPKTEESDALAVAPATSRYRLVPAAELAKPVAPMPWLIRGIWPERSAGVLGGEKKSLKTWNLQAIALAVAAGVALFSKYHVTSPGGVLYLSGEGGQDTFASRHQVIAQRYGIADRLPELPIGAEFGVGTLTDTGFTDAVKRHLDALQPKLVILDPLYAYHPSDVEVSNLYARGQMLADLRSLIGGEAALIVGDHFNKTSSGSLDLDNIAQAGMAAWADSWVLQRHRRAPDLENGRFQLELSSGTRRSVGTHFEVDWTLERDDGDSESLSWSAVDWEARPCMAKEAPSKDTETAQRILQVVKDYPFELTETAVAEKAGGRKEKTRKVLLGLVANGWLVVENRPRQEGSRTVSRDRVGLGVTAQRLDELVPDVGLGSERVTDE